MVLSYMRSSISGLGSRVGLTNPLSEGQRLVEHTSRSGGPHHYDLRRDAEIQRRGIDADSRNQDPARIVSVLELVYDFLPKRHGLIGF